MVSFGPSVHTDVVYIEPLDVCYQPPLLIGAGKKLPVPQMLRSVLPGGCTGGKTGGDRLITHKLTKKAANVLQLLISGIKKSF